MGVFKGPWAFTVGLGVVLHAGYEMFHHIKLLEAYDLAFDHIPLQIIAEILIGLAFSGLGAGVVGGRLVQFAHAEHPCSSKSIYEHEYVPGFENFQHRGRITGKWRKSVD